jgi:hypothetical protein
MLGYLINIELENFESHGHNLKRIIPTLSRETEEDHNNLTISRIADRDLNPTVIFFRALLKTDE